MNYKEERERTMGKEQTFVFRNEMLEKLWREELTGQISDGMWENTPNSGWLYWCNVKTEVGEETKLINDLPYNIKNNFQFSSLIQYVGDDMMELVKKYEPNATEKDLRKYLKEIKDAMKAARK